MGDVDVLRTEFARRTLRHRAQAELGAGEGGIADPAAHAGGSAGEEDIAPTARQHQARRLAPELSPNLGDGLRDQAAAVWDCEDAGLAATSIPSVNLTR